MCEGMALVRNRSDQQMTQLFRLSPLAWRRIYAQLSIKLYSNNRFGHFCITDMHHRHQQRKVHRTAQMSSQKTLPNKTHDAPASAASDPD